MSMDSRSAMTETSSRTAIRIVVFMPDPSFA